MKKVKEKDIDVKVKSFREKLKDKKYKAKVELMGYGIFIVALIIYLNLANMGRGTISNDIPVDDSQVTSSKEGNVIGEVNLFQKMGNNYQYDASVSLKKKNGDLETVDEVRYYGKSYNQVVLLNKENSQGNFVYYKNEDQYYLETENGLEFVKRDVIYDLLDGNYVELDGIKKNLQKASLDHVTDYSSGKKEYVYHLNVRDVILSYQGEELVDFLVMIEGETVTLEIDYSNLLKEIDENVVSCKVKIIYSNIGKIEEFQVVENDGV